MNRFRNRSRSLYGQFGRLLIVSAAAAAIVFAGLHVAGITVIDYFVGQEDYQAREDQKQLQSLQSYISRNDVGASDAAQLTAWVKKQAVVSLQVYQDGILTYDSYYPFAEFGEAAEDPSYAWTRPYTLQFANGSAEVILHGFYAYRFYNYALIGEIVCAFLLFLLIVMLGIRSLIRYIRQLSSEIKILEGGGLDYSITIKGRNELAELAQGLDAMRQSFLAQTQQEKQLALASQRMITEMSHDLRTPLTSIMLYTGILLSGKYTGEAQMLEYIRKIDAKAKRLKHLSDHLLEYALVTGEEDIPPLETLPVHTVFYDMLSEAAAYLEQQGFHMQMELDWTEQQIQVNMDYVSRIFDNLLSNIVKYGDPAASVTVRLDDTDDAVTVSFENRKRVPEAGTESNRIGLQNMRNMMRRMGGSCRIRQDDDSFLLQLIFALSACSAPTEK